MAAASPTATLLHGLPGDAERFERLLGILRCPKSGAPFRWEPLPQKEPGLGVWGLLHGESGTWPVIDTIPILLDAPVGAYEQEGEALAQGPRPAELVAMLREGRGREALIECLAIPYVPGTNPRDEGRARARGWIERRALGLVNRQLRRRDAGRAIRRRQLARLLARPADTVTATDLVWFFFGPGSPLDFGYLHYFLYRFCLPRTLAASSILSLVPPTPRPVLDLACGMGHFAHLLAGLGTTGWTVGGDFNFIPMWAGRRTFAREASFVLFDASRSMPLATDAFGAALCSDAFLYIPNKPGIVAEMGRVAGDHPLVFARLGNRTALPDSGGEEFSAAEWRDLLGAPERTWIASEDTLVKAYLSRHTPDMRVDPDPESLAHDKYLSLFLRPETMPAAAPRAFARWPHEAGRLGLNPIFTPLPRPDGGVSLRAWFENPHFCRQNAGATVYMPLRTEIGPATLAAIRAGERSPEVEALIRDFVLIGLPEHYAKDALGAGFAVAASGALQAAE